jgi:hypothetical protein
MAQAYNVSWHPVPTHPICLRRQSGCVSTARAMRHSRPSTATARSSPSAGRGIGTRGLGTRSFSFLSTPATSPQAATKTSLPYVGNQMDAEWIQGGQVRIGKGVAVPRFHCFFDRPCFDRGTGNRQGSGRSRGTAGYRPHILYSIFLDHDY